MTTIIMKDIQNVGVYYYGPISAVKEAYQREVRINEGLEATDQDSIVCLELEVFDDHSELSFAHTSELRWDDLKTEIFKNEYTYYLEYLPNSNWRGTYSINLLTAKQVLSFDGDYSLDYLGHDTDYRRFCFRFIDHDVNTTLFYIGLSEEEYLSLKNNNNMSAIKDWAEQSLENVEWIHQW